MAAFPELEPTTRSYDFGMYAMSEANAFGGGSVRFSHSDTPLGSVLVLGYADIHESDLDLIRAHSREQQVGYLSFLLPAIIWRGHSDPGFLVPVTDRWVYAAAPEEGDAKPGGFYDVSVSLRHVGPELGASYG